MCRCARRCTPWTVLALTVVLMLLAEPSLGQIRGRQTSGRVRVTGTVTDPDGNGLEGVLIRFVNQDTPTKNTQVKAKKGKRAGEFTHPLVEYGDYKIYAEKDGYKVVSYKIENRASDDTDVGSYGPVRFELAQEPRTMSLQASGEATLEIVMAPEGDYRRLAIEASQGQASTDEGDDKLKRTRHPAEEARELYSLKNYTGALAKFLEAVERRDGEQDPDLHFAISRTYYALENYDKAEEYIRATLEMSGRPPRGAMYYRALIAHKQGRTREAIGYLEKEVAGAAELHPAMLTTLGSLYRDIGENDKAIKTLEQAVAADSDNLNALLTLGSLLAAQGDEKRAETYFQKAAAAGATAGQDGATVFFNLGALNYNKKQYRTAAEAYRRAIEVRPDFADAHRELGYTLWDLHERRRAAEFFQKYLDLTGDAAQDRQEIEQLISIGTSS